MNYLGLCCIAKDEDLFLKEWIAYHALRGVERFFIYDNDSRLPIKDLLKGFIDPKRVTVVRIPGRLAQTAAYRHCLINFGSACRWIAFLDLDEFALPMQESDLRVCLSEFESYAALAATWHLMNACGHDARPQGPVIRNYIQAFAVQDSFHVKCFVQPQKTTQTHGPHTFFYKEGEYAVNEDHYPVPRVNPFTFARGRKIRINHYFVRSRQDFEEKIRKGRADNASPVDWTMFTETAAKEWVWDKTMLPHVPAVEKALAADVMPPLFSRLPDEADYEAAMQAAMAYGQQGNAGKAQALLCSVSHKFSHKAEFWLLRAALSRLAGHADKEALFVREAMKRDTLPEAFALQARIFREQGDMERAQDIERMLEQYSGEMELRCKGVTLEDWHEAPLAYKGETQ